MVAGKTLLPVFIVYVLGCLFTIGAFYRDKERRIGAKQIVCTLIWPIWWPVANGFGPMLDAIDSAATATEGRKSISFAVGLFAAGHCLSSNWSDCGGVAACTGVIMKSAALFFPPLNFGYVTWLVSQFA